jgi:signal transduction histidine kinase
MTRPLPTPPLVFAQLCGWGTIVALVQALLLLPIRPASAVFALPTLAIAIVSGAFVVARTVSLYRSARRAAEGEDAPPPSRSALGDAVAAPERVAEAFVGLEALAAATGLLSYDGALDPAVFLTPIIGTALVLAPTYAYGFRRVLRPWILAFPPSEVAAIPGRSSESRATRMTVAAVLGVGLIGTAIGAHAAETRVVALALGCTMTAGVAVVAASIAARLARRLETDVTRLTQAVASAAERGGPVDADGLIADAADPLITRLAATIQKASTSIRRITDDEQRTKSSIEESQKKKTVFMASMSHDLRSPLNSIMGFSELLISGIGGELSQSQRESVAVIQRSGSELLELLNDIIDSARLDASRLPLRRQWTPTVELLTEAIRKGRDIVQLRTGTGSGFTIEEELEPGLPPVYVDSHRIVQAVLCIFRHATMVMEGGAIRLSAKAKDGDVRVSITDTGTAFIDEDRERVFQAFRAMTTVSGRRIGGMGLSLSLARSLVRAHGGDIHYDPSAEGTTFHVTIPATPKPEE